MDVVLMTIAIAQLSNEYFSTPILNSHQTNQQLSSSTVSRSSNSVDDALQVCHTTAKELRANASALSAKFAALDQEHKELTQRVAQAAQELAAVSEQLSAAPKLADTPRRLAELQRTVATFGSQVLFIFSNQILRNRSWCSSFTIPLHTAS